MKQEILRIMDWFLPRNIREMRLIIIYMILSSLFCAYMLLGDKLK